VTARYLYQAVSQGLRERIFDGVYRSGDRIPPASELAQDFGVSMITIRRAIRDLSLEGLLVGRQGLGVFVARKQVITRRLKVGHIEPIDADIRRTGLEPSIKELDWRMFSADDVVARRLKVEEGAVVHCAERVLCANEEPVALDTIWMPQELGDWLRPRFSEQFLVPLLDNFGVEVDHLDYRFEADTANPMQASLLNVPTRFPLLVVWFSPFDSNGKPLLVGRTTARADRFTYEFSECLDTADIKSPHELTA